MSDSNILHTQNNSEKMDPNSNKDENSAKTKIKPQIRFELPPEQNSTKSLNNARLNKTPQNERLFPAFDSPQAIRSSKTPLSKREKVRLAPHHSALDWEKYKHANNVKMIDPSSFPVRLTKAELAKHNTPNDCWVALGGKIYNISTYLDYHPGGVDILIKYSGKDCTALFMKYHRWVNYERILDECFIGFLI